MSFLFIKGKRPWLKLGFIMVFLVIIAMLASLGVWQLQRAGEKRTIEIALRERSNSAPFWVGDAPLQVLNSEYRKGIAQGRFDNEHTMFLDNQIYQGQAGYYVLTPLRLVRSESAILINRGWVPINLYRQQLPQVDAPSSLVTVHGTLRRPSQAPFFLGGEESWKSAGWPKLIQYVDFKKLQLEVGYPLQPLVLQLASDEPYGFIRPWLSPVLTMGPQRHIAYAIQWFAMALIAVVIFAVLYRREFGSRKQRSRGNKGT
jgi:cytochrome oxidase assembly protein ShyY1